MKLIITILLFFISINVFGQNGYPQRQNLGSDSTLISTGVNFNGGIKGKLINSPYTDTTAANLQNPKAYPGAQIFTTGDNNFWVRNLTANRWIQISGGGGGTVTAAAQGLTLNGSTVELGSATQNASVWTNDRYVNTRGNELLLNSRSTLLTLGADSSIAGGAAYVYLRGPYGGAVNFYSDTTARTFSGVAWYKQDVFKAQIGHDGGPSTNHIFFDAPAGGTIASGGIVSWNFEFGGNSTLAMYNDGITYMGLLGSKRVAINRGAGLAGAMLDVNGTSLFTDSMRLFSRIGSTSDSVYTKRSDGSLGAVAQSSLVGVNIYNSNGTLTGSRTVNGGGFDLAFNNNSSFTASATSNLVISGDDGAGGTGILTWDFDGTDNSMQLYSRGATGVVKKAGIDIFQMVNKIYSLSDSDSAYIQLDASQSLLYFSSETGGYQFANVPYGSIDTTTYKPFAIGPSGIVRRMNSWAQVSAGSSSVAWNAITDPTGDQTLVWDNGEENDWTFGGDAEIMTTIRGDALTTGGIFAMSSSTLTTGNLVNLTTTTTGFASGNELLNLAATGVNATNAITVTGMRISVTNTNATSGTNIGLNVTASGATTSNLSISATGNALFTSNELKVKAASGVSDLKIEYQGGTTIYLSQQVDGSGNIIINGQGADPIFRRSGANIWTYSASNFTIVSTVGLNVDANTLVVDATNNRVAINNATASHALTLNGQFKVFAPQAGDVDSIATWKDGVLSSTLGSALTGLPYVSLATGGAATGDMIVTTGANTFTVDGTGPVRIGDYTSGGYFSINDGSAEFYVKGVVVQMDFYGAGAATFSADGTVSSVSDSLLKTIMGGYYKGLSSIRNIKPVYYQYNEKFDEYYRPGKSADPTVYIGFIAQNFQREFGNESVGHDANGFLSLNDRAVTGALVNGMNEQQDQIEKLTKRIEYLEKQLNMKK